MSNPETSTADKYFSSSVAPAFIIGTSLFAIFWGAVNAALVSLTFAITFYSHSFLMLQVRKIDMEDHGAVEALLDSHAKGAQEPLIDEDGNTIDTGYVMARIHEIGEKITAVSPHPLLVT